MKKLFFFVAGVALFSSCSSLKTGTSKTMDIVGAGVVHIPVVTELDVQAKKQEFTKVYKQKLSSLEVSKRDAVSELLKLHKADVLVEPTYTSVTKGGKITVTVQGWPASYKGFRQIEKKDLELLEVFPAYLQKAKTETPATVEKKNKK